MSSIYRNSFEISWIPTDPIISYKEGVVLECFHVKHLLFWFAQFLPWMLQQTIRNWVWGPWKLLLSFTCKRSILIMSNAGETDNYEVTLDLPWSYPGFIMKLPWIYYEVTLGLLWSYPEFTMMLPWILHFFHWRKTHKSVTSTIIWIFSYAFKFICKLIRNS